MNQRRSLIAVPAVLALAIASLPSVAKADLTLTAAGVAANFTLSTFANNYPNTGFFGVGPLGLGFVSNGTVIASDYNGDVRVFPTAADGQNFGSLATAQNYGFANGVGIGQVGNSFYMTEQGAGNLIQLNPNGTFNQLIASGLPGATGIIANPTNGHLFVSVIGSNFIADVDPIAKTFTTFANTFADGLSTDGKTLYAAVGGRIQGYDIASKTLVFDSGFIPGGPDGTALGTGSLLGKIFANDNDGTLTEIDLGTKVQTIIADSGSRGDFVTVAPDGSLYITQTDLVKHLVAPAGSGFGNVPEPGTVAMLLSSGALGLGLLVRRRTRK